MTRSGGSFKSIIRHLQLLLLLASDIVLAVQYPAAQPCFDSASASAGCDESASGAIFNACACANTGNWLGLSAACIEANDKTDSLSAIYSSLQTNCAGTNNPIAYSLDQWLAAAGGSGTTTTTSQAKTSSQPVTVASNSHTTSSQVPSSVTGSSSASVVTSIQSGSTVVATLGPLSTTSASPAPSPTSKSKLNTQSIVGIAIGIPCFLALLALLGFILWRARKQKKESLMQEEVVAYNPYYYSGEATVVTTKSRHSTTPTLVRDSVSQLGQPKYSDYRASPGSYATDQPELISHPRPDGVSQADQQRCSGYWTPSGTYFSDQPGFASDPQSDPVELQAPVTRPVEMPDQSAHGPVWR
ncbi:hypothetical protein BT63DRAFT_310919 [Microthyrium microscopicum]|uniref:Extracellular membrane protein CFEM domain-containing protein n=1 Tax=Microthyrium microscopicum TaxID=703497 RepID=A0A6A6U5G1_9PEZI|nr:hypothetical protein BT63DRAFT_310919 [Microthyrium microscopicum]